MPYHQLNSDALRPGDVILEAGTGKIPSLIRLFDRGELSARGKLFYHVLVYTAMSFVMEATREGVRSIPAARIITNDIGDFRVLRHPEFPEGIKDTRWNEFVDKSLFFYLNLEHDKEYNYLGAIATKLGFLRRSATTDHDSFFCSQLVAEGYRRVGVKLFKHSVNPEAVTPSMFLSDNCLLKPVNYNCFVRLPNYSWIGLFAQRRYDVIKHEPIPLLQLSHDAVRRMIATFGPRLDGLTKQIGKKQTIRTPQDLYLTLTFPDLPDADSVSDGLVEFMERHFPKKEIDAKIEMTKKVYEEIANLDDRKGKALLVRTLRRDIKAIEQLIVIFEMQQIHFTHEKLPQPLKWRSIHDWLQNTLGQQLIVERDFLTWRKVMLDRLTQ